MKPRIITYCTGKTFRVLFATHLRNAIKEYVCLEKLLSEKYFSFCVQHTEHQSMGTRYVHVNYTGIRLKLSIVIEYFENIKYNHLKYVSRQLDSAANRIRN